MTTSTTLTVTGMHCGSCGILIDEVLEELAGVQSAATDVKRERTVVVHDDTVGLAALVAAVAEAGYTATG